MRPRHAVVGLLLTVLFTSSRCTSPNPEFPTPTACSPGDRQCASPTTNPPVAMVCGRDVNDAPGFIAEPCPTDTLCDGGRCIPGQGMTTCQSQTECAAGQVCVPLVTAADAPVLAMYCVPQAATAVSPGLACQKDSDCQSYRCLQHPAGRYCLLACATEQNCAASASCRSFSITVNGVQGSILSCSPQ